MNELRQFLKLAYGAHGEDAIGGHLQAVYGIDVTGTTRLDSGVYRIDRSDGPTWVARVFNPERTRLRVEQDAAALFRLASHDVNAERPAVPDPVSMLDDQPVLVTEFVVGKRPSNAKWALEQIGNTLGLVHSIPVGEFPDREGGALHHIPGFEGLPGEDMRLSMAALDDIEHELPDANRASFDRLRDTVKQMDDCSDLPRSFVHPDPASVNLVATDDKRVVFIDWTGCGIGPRITCLAQVLGSCWSRRAWDVAKMQRLADAYGAHVRLTDAEIERVADAARLRKVWLAAWNYWTRTLQGRPPKGDEWWLLRAFAPKDSLLIEAVSQTFG